MPDRASESAPAKQAGSASRAHLLAHSKPSDAVQRGFIDIAGAIDMLSGLEYHHRNFVRAVAEIEYPRAVDTFEQEFIAKMVGRYQ